MVRRPLDLQHTVREPAPILIGHPIKGIERTLLTVDLGCREGQVHKVARERPLGLGVGIAHAAVVRFLQRDHVLDDGIGFRLVADAGLGIEHRTEFLDDFVLLAAVARPVVVPFVVRIGAPRLRLHHQPAPTLEVRR